MKDFSEHIRTNEIKNKINDITKWESKIKEINLQYDTKNYIPHFQQYDTIRPSDDNIYADKSNIDEAEID